MAQKYIFVSKYPNKMVMRNSVKSTRLIDGVPVAVSEPGNHIYFKNGRFETADKDEAEFLRNHRHFNIEFEEVTDIAEETSSEETVQETLEINGVKNAQQAHEYLSDNHDDTFDKRITKADKVREAANELGIVFPDWE